MPQNILLCDKPEVRVSLVLVPPREITVPKRNKSTIRLFVVNKW